ncbi:bromodomain adjacent to zinc finger domain protein 2B isoform X2 [Trichomycterus rosablanca]|uniref:bromodomain adjacent to zinc finger domain protein 2B isoform X2 n=1 Tax=Trichomycterus rosablanca TaxID=2290929 RepID=UPI002F357726
MASSLPMLSHPVFRLYSTLSGSPFGGLGTLGMPGALTPHAQLGAFPDWWRASDAQTALFPPLMGLPPFFTPPSLNQSYTSSKSTQGSVKGLNGTVNSNGKATSSSSGPSSTSSSPSPALTTSNKTKAPKSDLNPQNQCKPTKSCFKPHKSATKPLKSGKVDQVQEKARQRKTTKKKVKVCTTMAGISSHSDTQSGSSSDSSSDTLSSLDSGDLEKEMNEDEDRDLSTASGDSESDKEQRLKRKNSPQPEQANGSIASRSDIISVDAHTGITPSSCPPGQKSGIPSLLSTHTSLLFNSLPTDEHSKHTSVIKATGLAGGTKPLSFTPQPIRDHDSSSKPLCLALFPKPSSLSSSPKECTVSPSVKSQMSSPRSSSITSSPTPLALKASSRAFMDEPLLHNRDFSLLKQEPFRLANTSQLKENQKARKSLKSEVSSSSLSPHSSPKLQSHSISPQHSNMFLPSTLLTNSHTNGVIQSAVQDAPLALITKPRLNKSKTPDKPLYSATSQSLNSPINLSMGAKNSTFYSAVSDTGRISTQQKTSRPEQKAGIGAPLLSFQGTESDFSSSKDSDDSLEDDDDDDEDDKDSGDSLSDSGSNLDSDSDEEDDDLKDEEMDTDSESQTTTLKLTKCARSVTDPSTGMITISTTFNLQTHNSPAKPGQPTMTSSVSQDQHSTMSSSFSLATPSGSAKRRRVTDERALRKPLEYGWQRETRIRNISGHMQGEVAYYAPCGKKLKQYPDVIKYLTRNGIKDITRDNFSFSSKIKVGEFYEIREGPEGLQWCLLKEEEIIPRILAMEGQRGHAKRLDLQCSDDSLLSHSRKRRSVNGHDAELVNAKLLRRLEAQEIARQAAQMKLMRKLEKQAHAQAAKEAKRQQALQAAEEKRKQKEQLKILKQQEKMRRIEQIRVEKELRAQQVLEAKRKRKEDAVNAKILEAEKRIQEKELRRQQAIILKHQERERRRQHTMLVKALETRKKIEERERLKQEKRDEKRLNKERKLELRRLELEMVKELNKPNEDLCLADQKALPELSRLPGLLLPSGCVADCLMAMQFLRCFWKVLRLDTEPPTLQMLQSGLLNLKPGAALLQDLLICLLSAAVCDPGLPSGQRAKTALGEHISSVDINQENVSEILQIYMSAHCGQTELSSLVESLRTKAFHAHTPTQKASILAFLVNELACSKSIVIEIDKNIEHMTNLRREKWVIEGSLRNIHAKRTGRRESNVGGEENQSQGTPTAGRKRKKKVADSEDEDDEEDDSDDQREEEDEEDEEGGKKGKKSETCDEEDDDQVASVEELERQIEKLKKQQLQVRRKLFESSHSLRSMMLGQDRYKRRYWVLPRCGGVFVESLESGEGPHEVQSERLQNAQQDPVKEEPTEVPVEKPFCTTPQVNCKASSLNLRQEKDSLNLFLQKPDSFSKLSQLMGETKMSSESSRPPQGPVSKEALLENRTTDSNQEFKSKLWTPLLSPNFSGNEHHQLHINQLYWTLTERNAHWFSLLPRSPCDDLSLTSTNQSFLSQDCNAKDKLPTAINGMTKSALKQHWQTKTSTPNKSFGLSPALGGKSADEKGNVFLSPTSKRESPLSSDEKSPEALSPALEMVKNPDLSLPQPIPQEMLNGWWKVSNVQELSSIVNACHPRGIRERVLQKQIQKHMDYLMQVCAKNKDAVVIDVSELEQSQVCKETVQHWCVEEHAMDMDIAVLQQVEELVRKVTSASLQVKGWVPPEPQSEREDLLYYEHKAVGENESEPTHKASTQIIRRANNPLDIAVLQLSELEQNIERRYLKSPLSTTIQITVDNVGTVSVPAPAPSPSTDGDGVEEDLAPGMKQWRKALSEVRSGAQLSLCLQQLQRSIAWERSIMKVYCQFCQKGDNEELLLLCDVCDKGCHTYCHKPQISTIPEGDWYCPSCIAKASDSPQKNKKQTSRSSMGNKPLEAKRSKKASATGEGLEDDMVSASPSSTSKKKGKEAKKRKAEESPSTNINKESSPQMKKAKTARDNNKDLELCRLLLSELQSHQDAWPFMTPVNPKSVPGYRKIIKKPMDFSTIQDKLSNSQYLNLETFIIDVNLVFENCEKFNEDDSNIGRAGHSMRRFFQRRWTELLKQTN